LKKLFLLSAFLILTFTSELIAQGSYDWNEHSSAMDGVDNRYWVYPLMIIFWVLVFKNLLEDK
jgi:TRAP-type mannitol/chloroaromatic compound transport system permease small subunit